MTLRFEIPSKTFVIGEYLALEGTASMVLATEPCFIIKTTRDLSTELHPNSPGGQLHKQMKQKENYFIEDPHGGRGGFGRSTAEYLSVFIHDLILKRNVSGNVSEANRTSHKLPVTEAKLSATELHRGGWVREIILGNLGSFISTYQNCVPDYKPSGADLVAQVCGGLCWYDGMNFSFEKLTWPFPGYEIYVFKTDYKQKTHEHLKGIKNKNFRTLIPILVSAKISLEQANLKMFCQSLNDYYDILGGLGLSDHKVRNGVNKLREQPEILAAKACGAMGMDAVLVVARLSDADGIKRFGEEQGFSLISKLSQSHPGVCYTLI